MKQSVRLGILKFIAIIEISLIIYVPSFVLRYAFTWDSGGIFSFLLFFAFVAGGFLAGSYLFKDGSGLTAGVAKTGLLGFAAHILNVKEKECFTAKIIAAVTTILPVLLVIAIYRRENPLLIIFEIVFAILPYRMAIRASCKHYQDIMHNGISYFGLAVLAAALVATGLYSPIAGLRLDIYLVGYVYIFIFLVLKNQEDIDCNIYSKKYIQKSILPRNMRSFNFIAVLVLFAIILLLFNFKTVVVFMLGGFGKLFVRCALFFLWLISLLMPKSSGEEVQGGEKNILPAEAGAGGNPVLDIIIYVIIFALVLFMLYKLLPIILKKLSELFSRLIMLLKKVFNMEKAGNNAEGEYDDETETIRPEKGNLGIVTRKRRKRRPEKELSGITDFSERVRYIYSMVLDKLDAAGICRESSDTVKEIYKKSERLGSIAEPLSSMGKTYEKVRYGDYTPTQEELQEYENKYSQAAGLLKGG